MNRIRKPDEKDGWYQITPLDAAHLLDENMKNRPLSEARAEQLAVTLKGGGFVANGEPLILSIDGKLLDGQHRLRACQIAGKDLTTYVVHVESSAAVFDSLNCGKSRTGADRLSMDGVIHAALQTAILKLVVKSERGRMPTSGGEGCLVTIKELRIRRLREPLVFDRVASAVQHHTDSLIGLVPHSLAGFVHYMGQKKDAQASLQFLAGIADGAELPSSSPALMFRNRMIQQRQGKERLPKKEVLALLITAWNLYVSGKTVKKLQWNSSGEFPSFGS